jgi:lipoprotein-releasing system permease protein
MANCGRHPEVANTTPLLAATPVRSPRSPPLSSGVFHLSLIKNLPFEWLVGLRYTRAGKRSARNSFISFISLISMAGIALGVAALIVVLSVMNGFQKEVRDRMLSVLAHIEVFDATGAMPDWQETAKQAFLNKEVKGAAPYVDGQAMMTRDDTVRGVVVRGVLPSEEPKVSDVAGQIKEGSFNDLRPGEFNIVLGIELARSMRVGVGDKITLIAPQGQVTPAGVIPRLKQFTVVGIFEAGHFEFDSSLAFMHLEDAEKMFRLPAPSGLRLRIADMQRAPQVAQDLSHILTGDLLIRDWSKKNRNWFAAVDVDVDAGQHLHLVAALRESLAQATAGKDGSAAIGSRFVQIGHGRSQWFIHSAGLPQVSRGQPTSLGTGSPKRRGSRPARRSW